MKHIFRWLKYHLWTRWFKQEPDCTKLTSLLKGYYVTIGNDQYIIKHVDRAGCTLTVTAVAKYHDPDPQND